MCFVRGTRVLAPGEARPIEDLQVGDEVYSYQHATKKVVVRRIQRVRRTVGMALVRLEVGERVLTGTPDQPFRVADAPSFVPAIELEPGVTLRGWSYGGAEDIELRAMQMEPSGPTAVFNLTLEGGEQCYFAEGVLVGG